NPREEKITPRIRHTASWLWSMYILLTIIEIIILKVQGLDLYNALCLSLSTISAGGFSNHPTGLIGFDSKIIWTIGIFAFIAGINFLLTYKVLIKGKINELFRSEEFRAYFLIVMFFTLLFSLILYFQGNFSISDSIRNAFFETAATITST